MGSLFSLRKVRWLGVIREGFKEEVTLDKSKKMSRVFCLAEELG